MGILQHAKKRISTLLIAVMFFAISVVTPLLSFPSPVSAQEPAGNPQWMHRGLISYNGLYYYDNDTTDSVFHYDSKDSKFGGCTATIQFLPGYGDYLDANRFFYDAGNSASRAKYIEPQTSTDATGATDCGRTNTRDVTVDNTAKRRVTFIRMDDNTIIHYKNGVTFKKSPANARLFVREGDSAKCKDIIFLREGVASNSDFTFTQGQTQSGSSILYAVGDASNNDGDGFGYHSESYGDAINNAELKDTKKCGMVFSDIYSAGGYALVRNWSGDEEDKVDGLFSYGVNSQGDVYSAPPKNDDAFVIFVGDTSSFPVNPSTGQPVTGNPQGSEQVRPACDLGVYGWLLCNMVAGSEFALKATEGFIFPLLGLQPLMVSDLDSPQYKVWSNLRDIVNVVFIIYFLFIVFSQATSIGINNYGIKKLLPMLIATAILTNISYFIFAFFTDMSNIAAAGIKDLVEGAVGGDLNISSMPIPADINVPNVTLPALGTGGAILAILIKAKGFAVFVVPIIILVLAAIIAGMLLGVRIALINIGAMISAVIFILLLINRGLFFKIMNIFGFLWMVGPGIALAFGGAHVTSFLLLKTIGG